MPNVSALQIFIPASIKNYNHSMTQNLIVLFTHNTGVIHYEALQGERHDTTFATFSHQPHNLKV